MPADLTHSRALVAAFAGATQRLLYLQCAWLPYLPGYLDKIALGLCIGHSARALAALSARHHELHGAAAPPFALASRSAVAAFDSAAHCAGPVEMAQCCAGLLAALRRELAAARCEVDGLYDEASAFALRQAALSLDDALVALPPAWQGRGLALHCLAEDQPPQVLDGQQAMPPALAQPVMPELLQAHGAGPPSGDLLDSDAGICRLIHFIYAEIEVPAAQVCCRNIVDYGHAMPLAFTFDMARQVFDEARHARMAQAMLARHGGRLGDFPFHNLVWTAYAQGATLAEKLAIEQLIGEGNGLDMSEHYMDRLRARGLDDLLAYYRYLQVDEVNHCIYGNRWIRYLAGGSEAAVEAIVLAALAKTGATIPGPAPARLATRRAARFSEPFIARFLAPGAAQVQMHAGAIVWLTGLPGAGKSTLARALESVLRAAGRTVCVLDGDELRQGLCRDLGFAADARHENVRRAGEVAKLMLAAGMVVIGALIAPYRADRAALREASGAAFIEIYCRCPLAVCEQRDPKGLYRRARRGELAGLTGIDAPYEAPEAAELVLDTGSAPFSVCIKEIIALLIRCGILPHEEMNCR